MDIIKHLQVKMVWSHVIYALKAVKNAAVHLVPNALMDIILTEMVHVFNVLLLAKHAHQHQNVSHAPKAIF